MTVIIEEIKEDPGETPQALPQDSKKPFHKLLSKESKEDEAFNKLCREKEFRRSARDGQLKILQTWLNDSDVDIDAPNNQGTTALHEVFLFKIIYWGLDRLYNSFDSLKVLSDQVTKQ